MGLKLYLKLSRLVAKIKVMCLTVSNYLPLYGYTIHKHV